MVKSLTTIIALVVMVSFFPLPASGASSQEFHLSVFIPPIPGINVPENTDQIMEDQQSGITQMTMWEEADREAGKVLVKTIVAK